MIITPVCGYRYYLKGIVIRIKVHIIKIKKEIFQEI